MTLERTFLSRLQNNNILKKEKPPGILVKSVDDIAKLKCFVSLIANCYYHLNLQL